MNAAVLLAVAVWTALATLTSTQDTTACGPYDISKGTATCNGKVVNVYSLLCPNWNAKTCQVSQITPDGQQETYHFRGVPPGLPAAADIQSDCECADVADRTYILSIRSHC
eukprot:m.549197 g.549197  ORF g.549197 m.549197 type:complete len:111 (+) comp22158_c1_seq106:208-540(+)